MMVKSRYFSFLLLSVEIVSLRAKPLASVLASTQNLGSINFHAVAKGARNPEPAGLRVIPTKHILAPSPALGKALSPIRRNVVVAANSNRPINGDSNSFFDENCNNSGQNGGEDLDWTKAKIEEIKTYVLVVQDENFLDTPKINPAYSELESGKCYLIFRKLREDVAEVYGVSFHVFYWIGKDSSFTDAATAAYGAVIVDAEVHDKVQVFREVEGRESLHFKELFGGYEVELEAKLGAFENSDTTFTRIHNRDFKNDKLKIKIIRVFKNDDGIHKCGFEEIDERNLTIAELSHEDCYLIDSGVEELGIFIWMGKNTRSNLGVREEAVKRAESYLREEPEYNFTTPVTFVDQNEVPQFWSVEELINFMSDHLYH